MEIKKVWSVVFCVERPSKEGVPLGWGIELCGSSSCLGDLGSLLNTEGILTLPMFLLSNGSLIWMWSASFAWWCRVLQHLQCQGVGCCNTLHHQAKEAFHICYNTKHHWAKEVFQIHIKDPSLKRNIGKVRIPSVFNKCLKSPRQLEFPHSSIPQPKGGILFTWSFNTKDN